MKQSEYNLAHRFSQYDNYSLTGEDKRLKIDSVMMTSLLGIAVIIGVGLITGFLGRDNVNFLYLANIFSAGAMIAVWAYVFIKKGVKNPRMFFFVFTIIEGILLGAITTIIGIQNFDGTPGWNLVSQAVLGTIVIFFVCLFLYSNKIVRFEKGSKAQRILFSVIAGFGFMYLANFIISLVTGNNLLFSGGIIPIIIAAVAVIVASLSIINDFGEVEDSVSLGVPEEEKWLLSVGLLSGIVWVYVELLRLLVLLARNSR